MKMGWVGMGPTNQVNLILGKFGLDSIIQVSEKI